MYDKIKLFQTVADLHNSGKVKLSGQEQTLIQAETEDLIRKSIQNKTAMKAPENFIKVLEQLKNDDDPDKAYKLIVEFLKEEGVIEDEEEEGEESPFEEKPEDDDKPFDKDDKPSEKKDEKKGDDEPEDDDESEDLDKDTLLDDAKKLEDKDDKKPSIKELQKKDKEDAKKPLSEAEMGVEKEPVKTGYIVRVTPTRNLVAYDEKGPLFHAVPGPEIRQDPNSLYRLANRVKALLDNEGPEVAAAKCKAALIKRGGADDGVMTVTDKEVPPAGEGIIESGEADTQEKPAQEHDDSLESMDTETQEKPETINPTRANVEDSDVEAESDQEAGCDKKKSRKPARYEVVNRKATDVLDHAENVNKQEKPSKPSMDATDDADNESEATPKPRTDDALGMGETDFKAALNESKANLKKLYEARAKKAAQDLNDAFVSKFTACVKLASKRMLLNLTASPFKIAAMEVLTAKNVEFANGESFIPMDQRTASELIELISLEGHDQFVESLLLKAADLMEKDDDYLADAQNDLVSMAPVEVPVETDRPEKLDAPTKMNASRMREEAVEGNFELEATRSVRATDAPKGNNRMADIRHAVGSDMRLGRRLSRYQG